MTGAFVGRDGHEVEALVTDRYLDAILSAHGRGADGAPTSSVPDDAIRTAAARLARDLPRLHPSFRFEEALAARLAEVASRMGLTAAVGAEGLVVPLPRPAAPEPDDIGDDVTAEGRVGFGRPLLIGGALTSAAISIAGAAYVAWRLNRPTEHAMARAARAISRTRLV